MLAYAAGQIVELRNHRSQLFVGSPAPRTSPAASWNRSPGFDAVQQLVQ